MLLLQINWVKHKHPSDSNKDLIKEHLSQTFLNRRNGILEKNPTVVEIFDTYNCLIDYDGDLIDHEFSLMFPGSEDKFIEKFPTHFMPRIIKYAEFCKSDADERNNDIDDDSLKYLIVLFELLPVSNTAKNKQRLKKSFKSKEPQRITKPPTVDARKSLAEVVPLGTNLEDFIKDKHTTVPTSSTV